jgi:alginate O-acetyltransferase complex protein AlgJ
MTSQGPTATPLSRAAFVRAAGAASLALAARGRAAAAEVKVNNVLIEGDRWLLPGWETLTDADDAGMNATLDLVAETAKLLATRDIGLMLVTIPFKARYCDALAPGEISNAVATRYARGIAAMQLRAIPTVDLDAVLAPLQRPDNPIYYRTDQHWTSTAVEASGTAIAAAIAQRWKIPAGSKPAPLPPFVTEQHIGDLATLLPAQTQAQIGLETYKLRSAYDADLTGYNIFTGALPEPDDAPAVQLVGSSFVRPMWGLPQKMSAMLGRTVGLTFFNGDAGPYHTLLMNLRSTLPKRRPNVIVWQMTEANLHLGPAANGWWSIADLMSTDFFLSHVRDTVNAAA